MAWGRDTAELAATEFMARAGADWTAPLDIYRVAAEAVGVGVEWTSMPEEGRLLRWADGGVLIQLNTDSPRVRQRFTLAHELAHLALLDGGRCLAPGTVRAVRAEFDSEEVFANMFAGALLMPSDWLHRRYGSCIAARRCDLHVIEDLAAHAKVSLDAAAVRLRDIGGSTATLLHWQRRGSGARARWRLLSQSGVRPWERGVVLPMPTTAPTIAAHQVWETVFIGGIPLKLNGVVHDSVPVQLLRKNDDLYALVNMPGTRPAEPRDRRLAAV